LTIDFENVPEQVVSVTDDIIFDDSGRPLAYCNASSGSTEHQYLVKATLTKRIDAHRVEAATPSGTVWFRCREGH